MRLRTKLVILRVVLGVGIGVLGFLLVGCGESPTAPAKAQPAECVKVQADPNVTNPIVMICRVE